RVLMSPVPGASVEVVAVTGLTKVCPACGMSHTCAPVLLQVQMCSWVPLVVVEFGSSRHSPEFGFISRGLLLVSNPTTHCSSRLPAQVESCTSVPLAVTLSPPLMARHIPPAMSVPSECSAHGITGPVL